MIDQRQLDMFVDRAPEDPPRYIVNAMIVKELGGKVKDTLPEKGLPVTQDCEYRRMPPRVRLEDIRNGAQLEELAMRIHRENRRKRHRR